MTPRSRAREVALQLLFQWDHNRQVERSDIERFARERLREPRSVAFCLSLYDGVLAHHHEIDRQLAAAAANWRVARMAAVERNLLRCAAFELLFTPDTPAPVAIDEAVELARRYGGAQSAAFVNGVLDRLHRDRISLA